MFKDIKKMSNESTEVMNRIKIYILSFCMCMFLCSCGSENEPSGVKIDEPVIMGITTFDDYALALQLYEGEYQSDFSAGPNFGANWTGNYQLAIINRSDNTVIETYELKEWGEPMLFHESVDLKVTDYNQDGNYEVLIGQYASQNGNVYHMYHITKDLKIGHYDEVGELFISSQDMSPELEVDGEVVKYGYYDNGVGKIIHEEIKLQTLALN